MPSSSWKKKVEFVALLVLTPLLGTSLAAADQVTQVLDRVNAVSPFAVLNMAFDDPTQPLPFDNPPAITTTKGFSACQLTATRGLVCLDQNGGNPGRWVRKWDPETASGEVLPYLFSCEDPALGLDTGRSVESCTGITADDKTSVVVAGKRKGSAYNLIKVALKSDLPANTCTSTSTVWRPLTLPSGTQYCYRLMLTKDRPLLVDITYTKLTFPGAVTCTGVLGLENRQTLMFFKDTDVQESGCSSDPLVLADSKAWNTQTKETLQGATSVNFSDASGNPTASFALVVSNLGRVFAVGTYPASTLISPLPLTRTGDANTYYSLADLRNSRTQARSIMGLLPHQCATSAQQFGIRTSTKSGRLFATDLNFCEVSALAPAGTTLSSTSGLKIVDFPDSPPNQQDLTLQTQLYNSSTNTYTASYPPLASTLAPGISVDLSKCTGTTGCTLVTDSTGGAAATLSQVTLASTAKGMTLFQILNIPDCRWITGNAVCQALQSNADPTKRPVSGGASAEKQYLNITPLLPKEVTDQFPPNSLPPMYVTPEYRGQAQSGYYFDAFFGVPQAGVVFQNVFSLELYVASLSATGQQLGCSLYPSTSWPVPVSTLLNWDITVTVSERVTVVVPSVYNSSGQLVPSTTVGYDNILTNNGCGSTTSGSGRWSAYPYDMEMTPNVYHQPSSTWTVPEDQFAHLTASLFYDLRSAQNNACSGGALSASVCSSLASAWSSAQDKLNKCLTGNNYPKTSEAVRNCNSFNSQMSNYLSTLNSVPLCTSSSTSCPDPYNRVGELKARWQTINHVFNDRLLPSVPANGFQNPAFEGVPLPP